MPSGAGNVKTKGGGEWRSCGGSHSQAQPLQRPGFALITLDSAAVSTYQHENALTTDPSGETPPMHVTLKNALRTGRVVRVFALGQLCSPKFVEMVALAGGFDAVWLDMEHTGVGIAAVEEGARAGRAAGIDTFVRLPVTDYASVMRVLEAGASGFMASMVRRLDEVENLVRWARFFPEGERGINGTGVDGHFGTLPMADYFRQANEKTLVGAQIEHKDAVEVIEKIAAVSGLDFPLHRPRRPEPDARHPRPVGPPRPLGRHRARRQGLPAVERAVGHPAVQSGVRPALHRHGLPDALDRDGRVGAAARPEGVQGAVRDVFHGVTRPVRTSRKRDSSFGVSGGSLRRPHPPAPSPLQRIARTT